MMAHTQKSPSYRRPQQALKQQGLLVERRFAIFLFFPPFLLLQIQIKSVPVPSFHVYTWMLRSKGDRADEAKRNREKIPKVLLHLISQRVCFEFLFGPPYANIMYSAAPKHARFLNHSVCYFFFFFFCFISFFLFLLFFLPSCGPGHLMVWWFFFWCSFGRHVPACLPASPPGKVDRILWVQGDGLSHVVYQS